MKLHLCRTWNNPEWRRYTPIYPMLFDDKKNDTSGIVGVGCDTSKLKCQNDIAHHTAKWRLGLVMAGIEWNEQSKVRPWRQGGILIPGIMLVLDQIDSFPPIQRFSFA